MKRFFFKGLNKNISICIEAETLEEAKELFLTVCKCNLFTVEKVEEAK